MARIVGMGLALVFALTGCITEMQVGGGPSLLLGPQPYDYSYNSPYSPYPPDVRYGYPGRSRWGTRIEPRDPWLFHPRLDPHRGYYGRPGPGRFAYSGRAIDPWRRASNPYRDNGRCDDPRYETSNGGRAAPGTDDYDCSRYGDGLKGRYR